jgi:putative phosphoesterase
MVFGCLADTSGSLSNEELKTLVSIYKGVDMILHAGPLGGLQVVEQLESLAPTAAVSGPSEDATVRSSTYVRQVLRFGDQALGLMCGYGKPQGQKAFLLRQFMEDKPGEGSDQAPRTPPIHALVFGHNREAQARPGGGVFFFNPGSFSGRPPEGKRDVKRTVGLLYLIGTKWDGHIVEFK